MHPPRTYAQFLHFLAMTTDYERMARFRYSATTFSLDRMRRLTEAMGRPDCAYPVLHVAGTKGKGSTAHLTEQILRAHGLRTGLYTSPHLMDLRERIRIDGRPIAPDALLRAFRACRPVLMRARVRGGGAAPTFFEVMTLLALESFRQARVDAAVLEVGLGGRLDATNVVQPVACAITMIAYDHTDKLGTTLAAIAGEKAGIVKPGVPVVTAERRPAALQVIRARCRERGAALLRIGEGIRLLRVRCLPGLPFRVRFDLDTPGRAWRGLVVAAAGRHQAENASLALALAGAMERRGLLRLDPRAVRRALRNADLPGRLACVARRPAILVDGGHNPAAMEAVAAALRAHRIGGPFRILFGAARDKAAGPMLDRLRPLRGVLFLTRADSPRAWPVEELDRIARRRGWIPAGTHASSARGLRAVRNGLPPNGTLLVTGSFYLAGEVLKQLKV